MPLEIRADARAVHSGGEHVRGFEIEEASRGTVPIPR